METCVRLFGRRKIYAEEKSVSPENVIEEVNRALAEHGENLREEEYLYWYRRGVAPILKRKKEIRPEICNRVVVNNAEEVVAFKNGYFLTDPVSYVARRDDPEIQEKVRRYDEYVYASGKAAADNAAVDWFHTVGLGVEYLEPAQDGDAKEAPVRVYALDPRTAFVVYGCGPGEEPVMGIHMAEKKDGLAADVFTADAVYRLRGQARKKGSGGPLRVDRMIENTIYQHFDTDSRYVGVYWEPRKDFMLFERSLFLDRELHAFEDRQYWIPRESAKILTQYYGDFMQLPPENERVTTHDYSICERAEPV
ncbi:MAG: phage portal protein [Clostridia bacterium]|nr:phage portal protein [Clostridia bacterium]